MLSSWLPQNRLRGLPHRGLRRTKDRMLQKVKNKNIVRVDLLPSSDEIKKKYIENNIPEQKAEFISKNYETKVHMVRELQNGKMFSLYSGSYDIAEA
jgi:hypothetical protein